MKVLIIGGTGIISTAVVNECVSKKFDITLINRGKRNKIQLHGVKYVIADVRSDETSEIQRKLGNEHYDTVIDFLSYNIKQLRKTMGLARYSQYIFISSSSVYEENETHIYTENNKKGNTGWDYCKNKYKCERELIKLADERNFKYTIVRPYVTYSNKRFPYQISPVDYYTIVYRIEHELPIPVINPDGMTTVTDSRDFAKGLVGLIGNEIAYNTDFHITSDDHIRWQEISDMLAKRYGVNCKYVEIDRKFLESHKNTVIDIPEILFDKSREMTFDNTKIKNAVPDFMAERTIHESMDEIYKYFENDSGQRFNYIWTGSLDRLIATSTGMKVNSDAYFYVSLKDKAMYMIGRNPFLCFLYNFAKKLKSKIKE